MKKLILILVLTLSTISMKSEDNVDINKYQVCIHKEIKSEKLNIKKKITNRQGKRNNYPTNQNFDENIKLIKDMCKQYNIPYQAIIWLWWRESNWGNSGGAKRDNIHFGVKCHGKKGVMYYDDCKGKCCFMSYRTFKDSLKDLMEFFKKNSRYKNAGLFKAQTAEEAVIALKNAKYATDPNFLKNYYNEFKKFRINEL